MLGNKPNEGIGLRWCRGLVRYTVAAATTITCNNETFAATACDNDRNNFWRMQEGLGVAFGSHSHKMEGILQLSLRRDISLPFRVRKDAMLGKDEYSCIGI